MIMITMPLFLGDHFVSVLTTIKSSVRAIGEFARDSSEKVTLLAVQQQRLCAMLHELKGPSTPVPTPPSVLTPPRSESRVNGSSSRRASGVGGKGSGTGTSPMSSRNQSSPGSKVSRGHARSCPMLAPFEGTYRTALYRTCTRGSVVCLLSVSPRHIIFCHILF